MRQFRTGFFSRNRIQVFDDTKLVASFEYGRDAKDHRQEYTEADANEVCAWLNRREIDNSGRGTR